jgi:hypothetical protein
MFRGREVTCPCDVLEGSAEAALPLVAGGDGIGPPCAQLVLIAEEFGAGASAFFERIPFVQDRGPLRPVSACLGVDRLIRNGANEALSSGADFRCASPPSPSQ